MAKILLLSYAVLGLLIVVAIAVVLATIAFHLTILDALLLLAFADVLVILGSWRIAKRAMRTGKKAASRP